ncbi:RNA-binding protein 1-like [Magnolia sinica]|uniref:RNA-binding protein 1-like n=1 Tax=Magnolia sinica TaxID=86752 RepID=UPI00265AF63F|nr:RNA-binding protein 1-like [Magnolia sinica]
MADAFWRYGDGRQPGLAPPPAGKRPRSDFDIPGAPEMSSFFTQEERGGPRPMRDTETIGASYDRYLRNGQLPSYGAGDPVRPVTGGMTGHPGEDPRMMGLGVMDPGMAAKGRNMGFGGGRPDLPPLPPDASNTLYVEGLPANCTRREVSHIFRPFVGFKEVRLVSKESKHAGGDPLVLCFVDFTSPSHAAIALDALQGYKFDEHDRDSAILRLQFARYPGPRSGGGPRGRR